MKPSSSMFAWNDMFATGLTDVDAQHQSLFEIAARLNQTQGMHAAPDALVEILAALEHYAATHFATEEALMCEHNVSEAHHSVHRRAHESFIRQLSRARALASADAAAASEVLLTFVSQWLLHHVANMDRLMAKEIHVARSDTAAPELDFTAQSLEATLIDNINDAYRDLGDRTFDLLDLNLQLKSEIEQRKQTEIALGESKSRFRMMIDHTPSWEYWQGPDGSIVYVSPSCERITGHDQDAFMANSDLLYTVIHPEDRQVMVAHQHDILVQEDGDSERTFRIVRPDGEIRWIVHTCRAIFDHAGHFLGRRGSNRDITDRRAQADSNLLVATVFESVNEAVLVTDADNRIIVANTAFSRITGYLPEDVIGHNPGVLADEVPHPQLVIEQWRKLTEKGRWQGEMINRRKNGELYAAAVSIDAVRDDRGQISNFVLVFSDISMQKESERRIHYLAHHDHLTGMPNWTLFSEILTLALEEARQHAQHVALMFVDIDRFKQARDKLGHHLSDQLLKEFALRLSPFLRRIDTASRIGSDEFVVLLPAIRSLREAEEEADKILDAIARPFHLDGHQVQITASIGVALFPEHGEDTSALMKHADLAMYQAKQAGGGTAVIYRPENWHA